jgi:hypothetical protein
MQPLENPVVRPVIVGKDPGARNCGLAAVIDFGHKKEAVYLAHVLLRGFEVSELLAQRYLFRRSRRSRKTPYRGPGGKQGNYLPGWLSPGLQTTLTGEIKAVLWVTRRLNVVQINLELNKFDPHKMLNPEVKGEGYQRGPRYKRSLREFLAERDGKKCAYCGREGVKLTEDHVIPKSKGGTDCAWNRVLACVPCNQKKGAKSARQFDHREIEERALMLREVAWVNALRFALLKALKEIAPVELVPARQVKEWREKLGLPKEHYYDALALATEGEPAALPPLVYHHRQMRRQCRQMRRGRRRELDNQVNRALVQVRNKRGRVVTRAVPVKEGLWPQGEVVEIFRLYDLIRDIKLGTVGYIGSLGSRRTVKLKNFQGKVIQDNTVVSRLVKLRHRETYMTERRKRIPPAP